MTETHWNSERTSGLTLVIEYRRWHGAWPSRIAGQRPRLRTRSAATSGAAVR